MRNGDGAEADAIFAFNLGIRENKTNKKQKQNKKNTGNKSQIVMMRNGDGADAMFAFNLGIRDAREEGGQKDGCINFVCFDIQNLNQFNNNININNKNN